MKINEELNPDLYKWYYDNAYFYISQICRGNNIKIAIIDTGVDYYNQDLNGKISKGYSMFGESDYYFDNNGHGTYICGLLKGTDIGLLSNAEIIPIKAIDDNGNTSTKILSGAIYYAIDKNVDIIYFPIQFTILDFDFIEACKIAFEKDILIISAFPKNYNKSLVYYPMALTNYVTTIGLNKSTFLQAFNGKTISLGPLNSKNIDEGSSSVSAAVAVVFFALLKEWKINFEKEWVSWSDTLNNLTSKYIYKDGLLSFNRISEELKFLVPNNKKEI